MENRGGTHQSASSPGTRSEWEPKNARVRAGVRYTVAVAFMHGGGKEKHFGERYLREPKTFSPSRKKSTRRRRPKNRCPDAGARCSAG